MQKAKQKENNHKDKTYSDTTLKISLKANIKVGDLMLVCIRILSHQTWAQRESRSSSYTKFWALCLHSSWIITILARENFETNIGVYNY
jgi:hypothetical protein